MKNKVAIGIAGLVVVIAAFWFMSGGSTVETSDIIVAPKSGTFVVSVTTTGELKAKNTTKIYGPRSARQAGIWQMQLQRLVPEGTAVEKGDFVAELDKSELTGKVQEVSLNHQKEQSEYTQAQLDSTLTLSQARDELVNLHYEMEERQIAMKQSEFESPSVQRQAEIEYEKAKRKYEQETKNYQTKVKQAEAKMAEATADLQKEKNKLDQYNEIMNLFTIRAPERGMVIYHREWNGRKKTVGSQVSTWNPVVAELPDLTVMQSQTYINEVDIQKIQAGQKVVLGLDADPNKRLTGEVTEVANIGEQRPNSDSKVFEVTIQINESDTTLRPSMTTSNTVITSEIEEAIYVPLEAVHSTSEYSYVFKRDGSRLIRQQVRLGELNENDVVIMEGVALTDRIYLSMPADTTGTPLAKLPELVTSND